MDTATPPRETMESEDAFTDDSPETWMPPTVSSTSGMGVPSTKEELVLIEKENQLMAGEPIAEFTIPSGKKLRVYAKSEGQMRHINIALQEWWDIEIRADRAITKRWRFWLLRRYRVSKNTLAAQVAKEHLFRLIFADAYDKKKHQELSRTDFLSMTEATQAAIYAAFKRANDGSTLVRAILGDDVFESKKKALDLVMQRAYTPS